jgi:tetratricopeptide (TPR) repeat protein
LPELPRDIIRSAAVAGNEFRFGEVQALLPDLVDPSSMVNHIRSLVKAGLIELLEAGIDARYAFKKAAVREILYNNLPFERRRELHARLANYLTTSASRRKEMQSRLAALMGSSAEVDPAQEAERIAYHFEQAGERLQAASQYLWAAMHARVKSMYGKTSGSYQHTLICLEHVPVEELTQDSRVWKVTALFGQGDLAFTAGDYAGALATYEKACAEIPEGIEPAVELELHAKRSLALALLDRAPEGRKLLEGILGKYPAERNSIAAGVMAWLAWRGGDENKQQWIERALELIGEGTSPLRALLTEMKGDIGAAMQGYQQAEEYANAGLLQVRLGDRFYSLGDLGSARMNYEKAADFFTRRQPNLAGQALALFRKAEIVWEQEGAEAAQTLLKQALELVNTCVSSIRKEAREDILTAIQRVNSGKSQPFPTWKWTHFEDEVRIKVLFQL